MRLAVFNGIRHGLEKLMLRGEALVKEEAPVGATGQLANSPAYDIPATMSFSGAADSVAGMKAELFIGPPADVYGAPVELGTKPHFPPPHALLGWVKKRFNPNSEEEAMQIAWAVARKIAKRGTKAQHFFERATDKLAKEAQGIMEREICEQLVAEGYGAA